MSVADTAAGAKNFTTLLAAAQAAGLAGTLSSPSLVATVRLARRLPARLCPSIFLLATLHYHLTTSPHEQSGQLTSRPCSPPPSPQVFAPTDAAFAKFLKKEKLTSAQLLANPVLLKSVLSYHIVAGEALTVAQLGSGPYGQLQTLLDGQSLFVSGPRSWLQ